MDDINLFQLLPDVTVIDPLNIKSEVKEEIDTCESNQLDINDIVNETNFNEGTSNQNKIRIIDASNFQFITQTTSSPSLRINQSNKRPVQSAFIVKYQNTESSINKESELDIALKKSGDGKIVKRSYITNGGFLPDTIRTILVHLIIKHEMDKALATLSDDGFDKLDEFVITSAQMSAYASDIVRVFPSEKAETYFGGFRTVNGVRILANGKLWDHYNYVKSILRDQGLLEGRKVKRKKVEVTYEIDEKTRNKLNWLKNNSEPWSEVFQQWTETFAARTKGHSELETKQLSEYFQTFPCLRDNQAIVLIQNDFERLYKRKLFNIADIWNKMKQHIILKLQQCKGIKTLDDKAYVHLLPSLTSEQQNGVILFLLPFLVPNGRKKRRNDDEEARKMSPAERRDTFIIYVSKEDEVDVILEKKRMELKNSGRILHPTPVCIGTKMGITKSYVVVDDVKYEVSSLLSAIDLAFKIYYSAHCDFPESCYSMWLFIQKAIFDIHYPTDRANPSLHALAGELRKIAESKT
ncbi:uncharacterized protein LOC127277097 [Leptopilina boulardi]|uniref:uncharacterized protein LOC127277097 n=1 Tax=Leptopilina boulardi TaxID=63433 RepID=UPI0021F673B6|nr:uncharacterized protein LOC127277097 [Leptopilina boulardi]XP_051153883.1 uncharacterized protein LOC127277097 [Leptopilina boulardi]